jgi:hypothetical protein
MLITYFDLAQDSSSIDLPGWNNHCSVVNNWDVYASGTSGTKILNGSVNVPNITKYCPTDAQGLIFNQFGPSYVFDNLIMGSGTYAENSSVGNFSWGTNGADASIYWDGINWDDRWYTMVGGGDIARTGSPNGSLYETVYYPPGGVGATAAQQLADDWRAGEATAIEYFDSLRAAAGLAPSFRFCNFNGISMMFEYNGAITSTNPNVFGSLNQVFDSWLLQDFFGWGYLEGFYGQNKNNVLNLLIPAYTLATAGLRGPQIAVLSADSVNANGSIANTWTNADAATTTPAIGVGSTGGNGIRYYLAFTLMQSGALAWQQSIASDPSGYQGDLTTFDEMGNNGCSNCPPGYLGYPDTSSAGNPQYTAKYSNGLFERRFYNSTTGRYWRVVMNPRGNGAQTYNPGITLYKFNGSSNNGYNNAIYNNGSSFTTQAMADPDGGMYCESTF